MEKKKNAENLLGLLKENQKIIFLVARLTILLIFFGILLEPSILKNLLNNRLMLVIILFFNVALVILIFFELIQEKQKSIFILITNYLFLTISIILCYGIFFYIDTKILESNALINVWQKEMVLEREVFYFSGVTYFTIGYGDIIPIRPYAQVAAISEAFLGAVINLIVIGIALQKIAKN
ncbi:MAG: potassium channel family protein [Candidatus Anstonellaceae archaeon]